MKSMDDVRFVPGQEDNVEEVPFIKGKVIEWQCSCGAYNQGITGELEEYIESEERDPDIEYIGCFICEKYQPLTHGTVSANFYPNTNTHGVIRGKMYSDGTFIYFESENYKIRVN